MFDQDRRQKRRWARFFALIVVSQIAAIAGAQEGVSAVGPRVITVSSTGQPPFKNPGVLTLGTLTIQQGINFAVTATSATATGGKGGALTYAWDWGDGTPFGTGASPSHTYVVPGAYNVTVTILEANNPTPTVLTLPVTITDAVKSAKLQTNEVWTSKNNDSLSLGGVLRVPANVSPKGQTILFDIGGVQLTFTLDERGTGALTSLVEAYNVGGTTVTSNGNVVPIVTASTSTQPAKASVSLVLRKRTSGTPFVDAPFKLRVSNAYFQDAFAALGISSRDASRENVRITVKVTLWSVLYQSGINQIFSSSKGGKGKTR